MANKAIIQQTKIITELMEELDRLKDHYITSKTKLHSLNNLQKDLDTEVTYLREIVKERDEEIAQLKGVVDRHNAVVEHLDAEIVRLRVLLEREQMNFNRGNAVKYIARAGLKDPETEMEDLQKALWYINREIERIADDRG